MAVARTYIETSPPSRLATFVALVTFIVKSIHMTAACGVRVRARIRIRVRVRVRIRVRVAATGLGG